MTVDKTTFNRKLKRHCLRKTVRVPVALQRRRNHNRWSFHTPRATTTTENPFPWQLFLQKNAGRIGARDDRFYGSMCCQRSASEKGKNVLPCTWGKKSKQFRACVGMRTTRKHWSSLLKKAVEEQNGNITLPPTYAQRCFALKIFIVWRFFQHQQAPKTEHFSFEYFHVVKT